MTKKICELNLIAQNLAFNLSVPSLRAQFHPRARAHRPQVNLYASDFVVNMFA